MAESKTGQEPTQKQSRSGQQEPAGQQSRQIQTQGRQTGLARGESYWQNSPFSLMNRFADEMGRLFDDFGFGRSWFGPFEKSGLSMSGLGDFNQTLWSPQIEAFEREGKLIVRADLPGLSKDDVKIEISDDLLIIKGERRQENEESREGFYRSERSYGSFYRVIPLPEGVEPDNAVAEFRDGVLEITMPAPQRQQRRRSIEIGAKAALRAGAHTTTNR
jgi:HSP20 family protein